LPKMPYGFQAKHEYLSKVVEDFKPKGPEESIICAYLLSSQSPRQTLAFAKNYKDKIHNIRFMKLKIILLELQ
jgi:hypothetical protein